MFKRLLVAALLAGMWCPAVDARFSAFMAVTPEIAKQQKFEVRITPDPKNKAFLLVDVTGVTYHDAWLITVDKRLAPEQQSFRDFIWNGKFSGGKVLESQHVWHNKDQTNLPPLPEFRVRKDRAASTYLYMDHPGEVCDGGFYYSIDLPAFLEAK
jgi:hypothetical protein